MKYVTLIIGVGLIWLHSQFGWILSENEAIAATQQVKTGMDFATGRTAAIAFDSIRKFTAIAGGFFLACSGYLFIKGFIQSLKKSHQNKLTN